MHHATIVGHEVVSGILSGDPALQRESICLDRVLAAKPDGFVRQWKPLSDHDLRFHNVDTGNFFSDRVLYLDSRVHFDEVELVRVGINEKLNGAGVLIADLFTDRDGSVTQSLPDLGKQIWRRCDLDNFLVSTLYRAITFE